MVCWYVWGDVFKIGPFQAYQQIVVDEFFRELLTISTHESLFRFNRLPYGVASPPSKFQKIMESLFHGIEGVVVFIDDNLITGKNLKDHLSKLRQKFHI